MNIERLKKLGRMVAQLPYRFGGHVSWSALVIDSNFDKTAAIDSKVRFYRSSLGRYSYIGRGSFVESARIGSFCSIGGDCNIGGGGHPLDWVSTSPVFNSNPNIMSKSFSKNEYDPFTTTSIGHDVWLGNGVKVKSGVHIGTGAVVGMGSIVTKNIGPYEIWAGNPAKFIRKRFTNEQIEKLLDSRWWEWTESQLEERGDSFACIERFLSNIG